MGLHCVNARRRRHNKAKRDNRMAPKKRLQSGLMKEVKKMRKAAFAGKVKDFRLYLLAMKTWALWEKAGARKERRGNNVK